jgi:hypothetical protein
MTGMGGAPLRVRERRPRWPRRKRESHFEWGEQNAGMRRWLREPEPFERAGESEPYPAATVLDDLTPGADEQATLRVLARYTALRVLLLWGEGRLHGGKLLTERRVAVEHLNLLPPQDWERRSLERMVGLCRGDVHPEAVRAALSPAETAAKRGHVMGGYALYRTAYRLSVRLGWLDDAAAAALGIARLARMYEAPRSCRVWNWRARVLESRHAARQPEDPATDEATGGEGTE